MNPCCNELLELSYYNLFAKSFLHKQLKNLTLIKSYTRTLYDYTHLLKCSVCGNDFIHIPNREYLGLANKNDLDIIERWYSTNNELRILNKDDFSQLRNIKSYLADSQKLFKGKEHWIEIPCKVRLKNKDKIDFCTLFVLESVPKLGHFPLYAKESSRILFLSDVAEITASDYALNAEIRTKTHSYPDEMVRDIELYYIRHKKGTIYKVNDIANFLCVDDFKGTDFENIHREEITDIDEVLSIINQNTERNYLFASWTFSDNRTMKLFRRENGSS